MAVFKYTHDSTCNFVYVSERVILYIFKVVLDDRYRWLRS